MMVLLAVQAFTSAGSYIFDPMRTRLQSLQSYCLNHIIALGKLLSSANKQTEKISEQKH